jgi:hypothetical protein
VNEDRVRLAERARSSLVQKALAAYEDAALRGLCHEGAWEAAVSAMRQLDLSRVLAPQLVEPES